MEKADDTVYEPQKKRVTPDETNMCSTSINEERPFTEIVCFI